jgi:single-strand DNA-binding protein
VFNLVCLTGRLTSDAELKTTANGIDVTSFSIAVDRGYGENKQTDFINIVAWRQTANFITKNFTKGSLIGIEGSIQTRKYQDKDGNNRTVFEVVCNNAHFVLPKSASNGGSGENNNIPNEAPQSFSNADSGDFTTIDSDDDLPF